MTKGLFISALLVGYAPQAAQAGDRILSRTDIYHCQGQAVGYKNGSWAPAVFDDQLKLKIEEDRWAGGRREWIVRVMYQDWVFVGGGDRDEFHIFQPEGGAIGTRFALDVDSGRFTFMDSSSYLVAGAVGTAHMAIGVCRPARN